MRCHELAPRGACYANIKFGSQSGFALQMPLNLATILFRVLNFKKLM
jgi:hypothetical protein